MDSWATPKSGVLPFSYSHMVVLTPSEKRHLNIGAGRIVWQDIVKIDVSIKKKQFHQNETILASIKRAKDGNGRLHLLGLVSTPFFHL
jgi:2,3-bisphosphoglycerate-independent phosphoglycerate mutase